MALSTVLNDGFTGADGAEVSGRTADGVGVWAVTSPSFTLTGDGKAVIESGPAENLIALTGSAGAYTTTADVVNVGMDSLDAGTFVIVFYANSFDCTIVKTAGTGAAELTLHSPSDSESVGVTLPSGTFTLAVNVDLLAGTMTASIDGGSVAILSFDPAGALVNPAIGMYCEVGPSILAVDRIIVEVDGDTSGGGGDDPISGVLSKNSTYVAAKVGRAYQPERPARDVWETRQVCGYKFVGAGSGHYIYVTASPAEGGGTTAVWVPDNPTGAGGVAGGSYTYTCWTETVLIRYPATAEVPGITAVPAHYDYNLGWNSGARSLAFITDDGNATFKADASIVGAIVGLNGHQDPLDYTGTSIKFGFYIARGLAKVIEQGVTKGVATSYSSGSVFKVERVDSAITYSIDGALIYTSAVDDSTEPLWLQASLYSGDDQIYEAALEQVSDADLTEVTGTLTLTMPAPRIALSYGVHGVLRLSIPGPELALTRGLATPSFALLNLTMAPMLPDFYALVGQVGTLDMIQPGPSLFAADRPTGRLALTLPAPVPFARSYPYDTLYMTGALLVVGAGAALAVRRMPAAVMPLLAGGAFTAYREITMSTAALVGLLGGSISAISTVVLVTQPMVALLGGSIGAAGVLNGLNEVWVLDLDGGGSTSYSSYDFNSFAKIGDTYFAAKSGGIYELDGDDDAGEPIRASFSPGQLDFGTSQRKTVSQCYLGLAGDGGYLQLNLDAELNGAPVSYLYRTRAQAAHLRQERITLGKGLKSSYVIPTFYNQDGCDFTVDTLEMTVADLNRKI